MLFFVLVILLLNSSCLVLKKNVKIKMRDGVELNTDIFHEALKKSGPIILIRSPYGMKSSTCKEFAKKDYYCVYQEVRGTGDSGGVFDAYNLTAQDVQDTISYLKKQSFWENKLYTYGSSALGINQMLQGSIPDIGIDAQVIGVATGMIHQFAFQGGAYLKNTVEGWLQETVPDYSKIIIQFIKDNERFVKPVWRNLDLTQFYQNIDFPSIIMGGWQDVFLEGTLDSHILYRKSMPNHTYLVIETNGHCSRSSVQYPNASSPLDDLGKVFFQDVEVEYPGEYVNWYLMAPEGVPYGSKGGNYWVSNITFPKVEEVMDLYLQPDGSLSSTILSGANSDDYVQFEYDPNNPTPTVAGNNLLSNLPCGVQDLREVEERSDNIVFTSDTFNDYVAVTGNITAVLYVTSLNRNDTDFVVRISDVYPDGRSMFWRDGIIRMRWRDNMVNPPVFMNPGEIYRIEVNLWSTSYIINPGHKIRVGITSSNYPRYNANPNNGRLLKDQAGAPVLNSTNVVFMGSDKYPSRVSLPIVSMDDLEKHKR